MKLLHIDSSISGGQSVSRQLTASIVARLKQTTPGLEITYRDLAIAPVPHLCLSEIKHAHTDDGVRQEMAWAKSDQRHVLFAATARPC